MLKKILLPVILIVFGIVFPLGPVLAEMSFPAPSGYVNDYENILSIDQGLELKLSQFERETSIEVVVVTTPDFQGTYIEDYAVKLFEEWGIGKDDSDNGLLILVSSTMRESRFEVGYGLESVLTDSKTGRIQDEYMISYFQNDDFDTGISKGIDATLSELGGENWTISEDVSSVNTEEFSLEQNPIIGILIFAFILLMIFSSPRMPWIGGCIGVVAGMIIGYILWQWTGLFALPIPLGILGLILSVLKPIISSIMWSGFFRGSGKSSGSKSFGGFGGGSSGGGGSSRSW